MSEECPNCQYIIDEDKVANHPGLIKLNIDKRDGYFSGIELDKKLYTADCGIRINMSSQMGLRYHIHFGKVICPLHKVLALPASIHFSANLDNSSVDYYCTSNGHRIEVTSLLIIQRRDA